MIVISYVMRFVFLLVIFFENPFGIASVYIFTSNTTVREL